MTSDGVLIIYTSDKSWEEDPDSSLYSIIPNIQGQKYTLGDCYTSREDQGEFIRLPKYNFLENFGDICEINVDQEGFWISPVGEHFIRVNGVRLEVKGRLNFEDRFSIRKKDKEIVYLFDFKRREFKPAAANYSWLTKSEEADEVEIDGSIGPMQNAVIVAHILSYLPTRDVKNARIVSNLWNEEGFRILKKRSIVDLSYGNNGFGYNHESMRFFRYWHEMEDNPFPNWKIRLPNFDNVGAQFVLKRPREAWKLAAKYWEDIECFLQKQHNVKKLDLGGSIRSNFDEEIRIKILTKVQHTLEDLKLSGGYDEVERNDAEEEIELSHSIRFNNLRKLTLSSDFADNMTWWQTLIPAIQGIKALCLHFNFVGDGDLAFLKELESLPNLEEVSLLFTASLTSEALEWLLKLKKPLKKLELDGLYDSNQDDFNKFEQLLAKHSNTLECVMFDLPGRSTPLRINLPVFPKLKIWHVFVSNIGNAERDEFGPISLVFPNSDGSIIYDRHLPSLQSLTVWPFADQNAQRYEGNIIKTWEDSSIFFEQFFPVCEEGQAQQIFRTLVSLDVPYKGYPVYKPRDVFPRAAEIAAMFPNVFNEWANQVRKRRPRKRRPRKPIPPSTRVLRSMSNAQL